MKWSGREDLMLVGRSCNLLVVLINMYKNRYGIITIVVSMLGGCSESFLDDLLRAWPLYLVVEMQVNEVEQ
jgi:hypothetical protein